MPPFTRLFGQNDITTIVQKALVSLPRVVPDSALLVTSPEGPQPFKVCVPSRDGPKRFIPVYVFVPVLADATASASSMAETKPELSTSDDSTVRLPVILDFHGGGFFMGSCLEQAPFCAQLARELPAVVISVDYRMGPIDKFPAATEDAEDVLAALLDPSCTGHANLLKAIQKRVRKDTRRSRQPAPTVALDSDRISIAGFSSGANIALNLGLSIPATPPFLSSPWPSLLPKDSQIAVPFLLFFPSLDCRVPPSQRTRPKRLPPGSEFWTKLGDKLQDSYLPADQTAHPRASPGLNNVSECLHPRAKCLLVLPELDSLATQSEVWVRRVEEEGRGADLKVLHYNGMKHGWTQFPVSWLGREERKTRIDSFAKSIKFVRDAWEGRDPVMEQ